MLPLSATNKDIWNLVRRGCLFQIFEMKIFLLFQNILILIFSISLNMTVWCVEGVEPHQCNNTSQIWTLKPRVIIVLHCHLWPRPAPTSQANNANSCFEDNLHYAGWLLSGIFWSVYHYIKTRKISWDVKPHI